MANDDKVLANTTIHKTELTNKAAPKPVERQTKTETIKEGEVLDRSKFTDEEWARLVESGAVTDNVTDLLGPTSTKTSEVQKAAADSSPPDAPRAEDTPTSDELNERANKTARIEREIARDVELSNEVRLEIAKLPAQEQPRAIQEAKRKAVEKALSEQGLSEGTGESQETPPGQPSRGSTASQSRDE